MLKSYIDLDQYLAKGKNKNDRPLANNTRVVRLSDSSIGIKLHNTIILTFFANDWIQFNTGGWKTITTRERMNRYQNICRLYTKKRIWYLLLDKKEYLYQDGIVLDANEMKVYPGMDILEELPPINAHTTKKQLGLKKQIDQYCNRFVEEFVNDRVPAPSGADCWYCSIFSTVNNSDHLLMHIEENYYVPSLLFNAITQFKHKLSIIDQHNLATVWNNPDKKYQSTHMNFTAQRLRAILKSYMYQNLGFGF